MRRAGLVLLLVLGAAAAPARASTVNYDGVRVLIMEQSGEPNAVSVAPTDDGRLEITDAAGINPGEQCESVSATVARCPRAPVEAVLDVGPNLFEATAGVPVTVYGGASADRFQGGPGADRLYGGPGRDELSGGDGADLLRGHEGDDLLLGEAGVDSLYGEGGFDELDGGVGRDLIRGGFELDRLRFRSHPSGVRVSLEPGALRDAEDDVTDVERVEGTPFADVILGGRGDDRIEGGAGDDRLSGGLGADVVDGGDGGDLVLGDTRELDDVPLDPAIEGGPDELFGGPGMDQLRGDAGRDTLSAGSGDDVADGREPESTQEIRDEQVACGEGLDRAVLDWNDEPVDCEELQVRPRPGTGPAPFVPPPPPAPGPGPQPALGLPMAAGGVIRVSVHCPQAAPCAARLRLRSVRTVRIGRRGRRRSSAGPTIATGTKAVAAGSTAEVQIALPASLRARLRRGARVRVMVELRLGGQRFTRPLRLTPAAAR